MKAEKIVFKKQRGNRVSLHIRSLPATTEVLRSRTVIGTWLFWLLKALTFVRSQTDSG